MEKILEKEFKFYLKNQEFLVKQYNGKFLVIKGEAVIGVFDTEIEAYIETSKRHKVGTFLIQFCSPGIENYTQTFQSRVMFS
ncbi:MAG: hypothetical protein AB1775_15005 [Bacteroidota bacterium]